MFIIFFFFKPRYNHLIKYASSNTWHSRLVISFTADAHLGGWGEDEEVELGRSRLSSRRVKYILGNALGSYESIGRGNDDEKSQGPVEDCPRLAIARSLYKNSIRKPPAQQSDERPFLPLSIRQCLRWRHYETFIDIQEQSHE